MADNYDCLPSLGRFPSALNCSPLFLTLQGGQPNLVNEHEPFGLALVLRGAEERLAPILMTAACAALALLPLVWRGNIPGHEIEYPMAIVILGGLVTSTLLNLFLMPALYLAFGKCASIPKRVTD